jgi:peptide/nickel transport system ATP-binding protein
VRGVSFTLGRERLGIVGESGSGKTMTGRAVLRLIRPPGRIRPTEMVFDGQDLMRRPNARCARCAAADCHGDAGPEIFAEPGDDRRRADLTEGLRQRDRIGLGAEARAGPSPRWRRCRSATPSG